jgi:hypothetical protein
MTYGAARIKPELTIINACQRSRRPADSNAITCDIALHHAHFIPDS